MIMCSGIPGRYKLKEMHHQHFTDTLTEYFESVGVERIFAGNDFILKEGEVEKNLYFIQSGAVRIFRLSEFEEQTIRFGYPGSFINSLSSFITATPSEFYIQTFRKTTLKMISKEDFRQLVTRNAENIKQYAALLEILITQQIEREIDLLTVSVTERLKRVLQRSPDLFQQVPLKYIASYLRMTPETLSRIRNS